jgi:hypothetical protein
LREAREQIATNKSFISYYRRNDRNGTSQRSIADSWLPPTSTRSRSPPDPMSFPPQNSSMPMTSCCCRQCANVASFAPSDLQSTDSRRSWAPTWVSRRTSIPDRRHSRPSTYPQSSDLRRSSRGTRSSHPRDSSQTSLNSSMEARNGRRLSKR